MGIEDQIAYVVSLADQIQENLILLEKPTTSFEEPGIHQFLCKQRVTPKVRRTFEEYTKAELQLAIGRLRRILAEYQKQRDRRRDDRAQATMDRITKENHIVRDGIPQKDAQDWMMQNANTRKLPELFVYLGTVRTVKYWRKRDEQLTLYTLTEAMRKHTQYFDPTQYPFEKCYEEFREEGWHELLYRPLYKLGAQS